MGGGVSLGTFSGSALTECIKEFIVFHPDKEIEIDVFSGASAGAISLAVMLRIMASFEDKLPLLKEMDEFKDAPDIRQALLDKLKEQYGHHYDTLSQRQQNQLLSAQVAQEFQKLIWCYEAEIKSLVGIYSTGQNRDLTDKGSLLDRERLLDLARKTIIPVMDGIPMNHEDAPLADRVLFANTLTRIDPIEFGSAKIFSTFSEDEELNKKYTALFQTIAQDGTSSKTHRDVRVFDITFPVAAERSLDPRKNIHPSRWLRAQVGGGKDNDIGREIFDLANQEFWATVVATALACGAFPFAFEQVPLTRYDYEYGQDGIVVNGKSFRSYTHSYIDGGTFNNEPISEAFRLSSFIDSMNVQEDAERYVVFVDPFLTDKSESKVKDFYRTHLLSQETNNVLKVPGLSKLMSFLSPMIGILRSEGSISELDKSVSVLDKFEKRKQLRAFFSQTIDFGFVSDIDQISNEKLQDINTQLDKIRKLIAEEVNLLQTRTTIPKVINFYTEVRKMLTDPDNRHFFSAEIIQVARQDRLMALEGFKEFFDVDAPTPLSREKATYSIYWLKCLYFILLDITMDLIGKDDRTKLIPIGPVKFTESGVEKIKLAGQPLEAFIGFFDFRRRIFDFEVGRSATRNILHTLQLGAPAMVELPNASFEDITVDQELKTVLAQVLEKRVGLEMVDNIKKILNTTGRGIIDDIFDQLLSALANILGSRSGQVADKILAPASGLPIELKIKVPEDSYQIEDLSQGNFAEAFNDRDISVTRDEHGNVFLLTVFPYYEGHGAWQQDQFIKDNQITIKKDRRGPDTVLSAIPLPGKEVMEEALRYPYPILRLDYEAFEQTGTASWEVEIGIIPLEQQILKAKA